MTYGTIPPLPPFNGGGGGIANDSAYDAANKATTPATTNDRDVRNDLNKSIDDLPLNEEERV